MAEIGLEEYMNCVLVQAGQRPAFLIQPADYREATSNDPKTKAKVSAIKRFFPDLIISNIKGEALVSKRAFSEDNFRKNQDMGDALGYPCAAEYEYTLMHKNEPDVSISVEVTMTDGTTLQILANACKDDSKFDQFVGFAASAEAVLKADPRLLGRVVSVSAVKKVSVPAKFILQKLIRGEALNSDEEHGLRNEIWNMGWEDGDALLEYNYEFNNPVHRGILITLLTNTMNDPLEPFYPLTRHAEYRAITIRMRRWSRELRRVLNESRITPLAGGGGRQRKTRKVRR